MSEGSTGQETTQQKPKEAPPRPGELLRQAAEDPKTPRPTLEMNSKPAAGGVGMKKVNKEEVRVQEQIKKWQARTRRTRVLKAGTYTENPEPASITQTRHG